jgi:hypothetical protein
MSAADFVSSAPGVAAYRAVRDAPLRSVKIEKIEFVGQPAHDQLDGQPNRRVAQIPSITGSVSALAGIKPTTS